MTSKENDNNKSVTAELMLHRYYSILFCTATATESCMGGASKTIMHISINLSPLLAFLAVASL